MNSTRSMHTLATLARQDPLSPYLVLQEVTTHAS